MTKHEQKHSYTLYYFDSRGRAEPIRLIFQYFGVHFNDQRLTKEEWANMKPDSPMGQLPYLSIDDGKIILCQMTAICRYLAKSLKPEEWFAGSTKSDSAKCDMYVEAFMDYFILALTPIFEKDEEVKATKQQVFDEQGPVKLRMLEQHLKQNGGKQFVGKKVTWCDLLALCILSLVEERKADLLEDFPILKKHYLRMRNLPEISDYIKENWPASPAAN